MVVCRLFFCHFSQMPDQYCIDKGRDIVLSGMQYVGRPGLRNFSTFR